MGLELEADAPHRSVEQAAFADVLRRCRRTGQLDCCGARLIRLRRDGKRNIPDPFGARTGGRRPLVARGYPTIGTSFHLPEGTDIFPRLATPLGVGPRALDAVIDRARSPWRRPARLPRDRRYPTDRPSLAGARFPADASG